MYVSPLTLIVGILSKLIFVLFKLDYFLSTGLSGMYCLPAIIRGAEGTNLIPPIETGLGLYPLIGISSLGLSSVILVVSTSVFFTV